MPSEMVLKLHAQADADELRELVEALKEGIRLYASHRPWCPGQFPETVCTCGLAAVYDLCGEWDDDDDPPWQGEYEQVGTWQGLPVFKPVLPE